MSIILKTTNLCKSFSRQTVVNNISLNIEKNSVYGLLGPNGAGKSTTLKMITGILKPTSGSIEFDGHAWRRKDLNDIGTLIETPPLYENLTAFENLKVCINKCNENLNSATLDYVEKEFEKICDVDVFMNLDDLKYQKIKMGIMEELNLVKNIGNKNICIFLP